MNSGPLRSISNGVEFNVALLGRHLILGLDILIKLDQVLGDALAKQADDDLAIVFGDRIDFWLVVGPVDGSLRLAGIGILIALLEQEFSRQKGELTCG